MADLSATQRIDRVELSASAVEEILRQIGHDWAAGEREQAILRSNALEAAAEREAATLKQAAITYQLASLWRRLDEPERARMLYRRALSAFSVSDGELAWRGAGICAEHLGEMARAGNREDEAIQFYRQAASVFGRAGHRRGEAIALNNLGNVLEARGGYAEAEECLTRALELSPADAAILGNLALVAFDRFDILRARDLYEEALAHDDGRDPQRLASHLGGLGNAYRALANYPLARECYMRARDFHRQQGAQRYEGVALGNLGMVRYALGELSEAMVTLEDARRLSHEFGSPQEEVNDCQHLSIVYRELGELDRARECLLEGWELAERHALNYELGALSEGLGNLYWQLGDHAQAKAYFKQARETSLAHGDTHQSGTSLMNLGSLALEEGNVDGALALYEQSLSEAQAGHHPAGAAAALINLGLAWTLRDGARAESYFQQVSALAEEHLLADELYRAHANLAWLYEGQHRDREAIAQYEQAIEVLEKFRRHLVEEEPQLRFFAERGDPYKRLPGLYCRQHDTRAAWTMAEQARSRAFLTLLAGVTLPPPAAVLSDWRAQEQQALDRMAQARRHLLRSPDAERPRWVAELLAAKQQADALLQQIEQTAPEYAALRHGVPATIADVHLLLRNGPFSIPQPAAAAHRSA